MRLYPDWVFVIHSSEDHYRYLALVALAITATHSTVTWKRLGLDFPSNQSQRPPSRKISLFSVSQSALEPGKRVFQVSPTHWTRLEQSRGKATGPTESGTSLLIFPGALWLEEWNGRKATGSTAEDGMTETRKQMSDSMNSTYLV